MWGSRILRSVLSYPHTREWGLAVATVCVVFLVADAFPTRATAETPSAPIMAPLPAPDQSNAIPLRAFKAGDGRKEQWEDFHGQRIVRNVTVPTLTPVLPDPAKATGAAVVVAPGGAFMFLSMDSEGYMVARWLADHGIAAFVLKYRTQETPRDDKAYMSALGALMRQASTDPSVKLETPPQAVEDGIAAVQLVRARAAEWAVDPDRVGFLGFSAGAMTTLAVGLVDDTRARPDFIAPIYGPMSARTVPADAPPMFVAVALDDPLMARGKNLDLISSWRDAGRPIEVHLYEHGGHGFGMTARRPASALWIDEFYAWMSDRGLLKHAN